MAVDWKAYSRSDKVARGLSIVLVLPFGALVAFAALIGAAIAKRPKPRLIWPFAFSTIAATLMFLRLPDISGVGLWLVAFAILALWAAIGSIIGAVAAKILIAVIRLFRPR